jgi:monofunctional biosynthetic peptidoglycan transglycosylase
VAEKDSQDGTESDAEGRVVTGPPRTEGGPAGASSTPADCTGEILSITPEEIASTNPPPPVETIDIPFHSRMESAGEALPANVFAESEELAVPEQAGAEALHLERTAEIHVALPAGAGQDEAPAQEEQIETPPQMPQRADFETLLPGEEPQAPSAPERLAFPSVLPRAEPAASQAPADAYAPPVPVSDFDRRKAEALRLLIKGARYAAYGIGGYLALVVFLIFAYRLVNPPGSTLMLFRALGGTSIERTWVPLERISPNLVRAVIVAEDGRFCDHWGIDFEAIREAIRRSGDGTPRGASTISMQVTKNLFLWPSKSYLRKVIELPLTLLIELVWPKWRILEIYLNVAEWGPGVFGAEAAARHHFRRPASRLSEREAALLAASLPNPVRRDAGDPGPQTSRKARVIQARMHVSGPVAACVTGNR